MNSALLLFLCYILVGCVFAIGYSLDERNQSKSQSRQIAESIIIILLWPIGVVGAIMDAWKKR